MATTPNYGWVTPAPTDFVTDLPADFETFADAADATVKALNPGTTAGDLDYYTSGTAKARLAIGTAGQVLQVNAGATGPEWATPASGNELTYTLINTGGTALTGATTITVSGLGGYSAFYVLIRQASSANAYSVFSIRPNAATTGVQQNQTIEVQPTYGVGNYGSGSSITTGTITVGRMGDAAGHVMNGAAHIFGGATTGLKAYVAQGAAVYDAAIDTQLVEWKMGLINPGAEITSMDIVSSTGNFDAGTVYIYGA